MICRNCNYNNRDGVEFCRHCGISLKESSRRTIKVKPSVKKAPEGYEEPREYSLNSKNKKPPILIEDGEEEKIPRGGANYKSATIAVGLLVIACVIAFFLFAFDILTLPGSGGTITVNSSAAPAETPTSEPTPTLTPVPTVAIPSNN